MANTLASRQSGTYADNSPVTSGTSSKDVSNREDLANFISMITRDETPFMSSIGKTKATAIYHEWQTDALETPGNSRIIEGLDYAAPSETISPSTDAGDKFNVVGPNRTRLGNYCQINGKSMAISGTRRAIDQAGIADEYAYQLKKRGTELRRDVEFDLVHSYNVSQGGTSTNPRTMGGYQSWINDSATVNYVGTADTDATQGDGLDSIVATASAGAATQAALALSDIDEVMQKIYEEGGKADKIMVSPKLRRDFSDLMVSDGGVRRNIDEKGKLRQSVDVYMSDFGDLMVIPNYIMGLSHTITPSATSGRTAATNDTEVDVADFAALIYDSSWFSIATLRPLQEVDVGQRGDSTVGMMVEEFTLEVKNPVGCGAIYGLE